MSGQNIIAATKIFEDKTLDKNISKDKIGEFIFNLRKSNHDRLFGIVTNFCDIKIEDKFLKIVCKDPATFNEIEKIENKQILESVLVDIGLNFELNIEYTEKERKNINIVDILKKEFKNILKIKEN